jgi:preprotein translocase subunit SecA
MVSRQIEKAQRKVEAHNFDIRKNLLDFDDVNNDQRKVIYEQRNELLETDSVQDAVAGIRADVVDGLTQRYVPVNSVDEQWNLPGLEAALQGEFGLPLDLQALMKQHEEFGAEDIAKHVQDAVERLFREKEALIGSEMMRALEKHVMLTVLDTSWKEHLARMDYLRQGIHLRGYAQKQPKQEYKREAFELFSELLDKIKSEVVTLLARVRIRSEDEVQRLEAEERRRAEAEVARMQFQHESVGGLGVDEEAAQVQQAQGTQQPIVNADPKVGRNDPCPCGSGKKYKHCHGRLA